MYDATFNKLLESSDRDFFFGIRVYCKQILYDFLLDGNRDCSRPILTIQMPCGYGYSFENREDLPEETLMCFCKNPKHVVIKYSTKKGERK